MKSIRCATLAIIFIAAACGHIKPASSPTSAPLVLTNATLIDGTGVEPIRNATMVINGDRIIAIGSSTSLMIPANGKIIDLEGATILPGLINAHVHDAYKESRLQTWAQAGVTTVRDEGIISGPGQLDSLLGSRGEWSRSPLNARLISAGYMLSAPGGYGQLDVTSVDNAYQQVNSELDQGVDLIKIALESGYAGVTNLPNLSSDELKAIVEASHDRGVFVSAHLTDVKFLQQLMDAGVDDLAHVPYGHITPTQIEQIINQDIYVVSTLTVFDAYGVLQGASNNLKQLAAAGVPIAMGNDYTAIPQNNFDHFELGMPMHEITHMSEAGMTPMQIIVASTRNAAHVCGLAQDLGTLEVGKIADILIVEGDPLKDLNALTRVKMVIHNGEIIRQ